MGYYSHTDDTVLQLQEALDKFHVNKDVFIHHDACKHKHFNFPKIHMMQHYVDIVKKFGSTEGFIMETSEHQHIDLAKNKYRESNKKHFYKQMMALLT